MILTTSDIYNVHKFALFSRLWFLLISIISNFLILDHTSDSFSTPTLNLDQFNKLDKIIWMLFNGLLRWDAQHFIHIASNGYTYENNLPFFPLFPVIIKNIAQCLRYIFDLHAVTSLLLSSYLINCVFFIKAASTLYILTFTIYKNQNFAYYTVLFFCISPATIFFIAPYSESLFSFCVFKGMLKYTQNRYWYSLLWFSISGLARANGIVNVGFILHLFYYYMLLNKHFKPVIKYLFYSLISLFCVLLPFLAYQFYSYLHFCIAKHNHSSIIFDYAKRNQLLLAGENGSVWCNSTLPLSYAYIQEHYWNVGLFRYYSLKQIPNFCLALPIVILIFRYCGKYLYDNWRLLIFADIIYKYDECPLYKLSASVFVFVVHVMYLTIFAVVNINVQVTTRFIASSSPFIYWIAVQEFIDKSDYRDKHLEMLTFSKWVFHFNGSKMKVGNLIKLYFLLYAVVGTILFSNNFPWT